MPQLDTPTDDPVAVESTAQGPALDTLVESDFDLRGKLKEGYPQDPFFRKILDCPDEHARFKVRDGLIWHLGRHNDWVLCIPKVHHRHRLVTELIVSSAHAALGHLGSRRTSDYVRRWYWW
ncbi:hypothetical protein OH77DRAFT_1388627, partial [Trametes cingulata]